MHFTDLTPCNYFPLDAGGKFIAVGWLEPDRFYPQGSLEKEFVDKLADLLVNPWQPCVAMGYHRCGFCRLSGGPSSFRNGVSNVEMGVSNLFVPGDGFLYVAPSLILHYMDAHGYSPPAEFHAAVMACPVMRSMEYLKAILKNGPKGIVAAK
jgi:hypothetical protein